MQEEIIEEDWSHYPNTTNRYNVLSHGDADANVFSYYQTQTFSLALPCGVQNIDMRGSSRGNAQSLKHTASSPASDTADPGVIMKLCCLESLTPLDMLDLSTGVADATGSRVWLGAQWFMKCMVIRPYPLQSSLKHLGAEATSSLDKTLQPKSYFALMKLRKILFHEKKVLELGAGTGASLIAVGLASTMSTSISSGADIIQEAVVPSLLTLTDSDPVALSLCQVNCDANLSSTGLDYHVVKLEWGKKQFDDATTTDARIDQFSHDTIVATDVIYDLSALKPLMETTSLLLKRGGYFVLSHIPRASVEDCELKDSTQALEHEIRKQASNHNLILLCPDYFDLEGANDIIRDALECLIPPEGGEYAIRPSSWMKCWKEYYADATFRSTTEPVFSDACNDECIELESIGASIMIFVKL